MHTPPFLLFGVPVIVALGTMASFSSLPAHAAPSDTSTAATAGGGETSGKGEKHQHRLLNQLNLTSTQKQQIDQVRQSTTGKKERHQAIMKILTPEQRVQLKELRKEKAQARGAKSAPSASTGA